MALFTSADFESAPKGAFARRFAGRALTLGMANQAFTRGGRQQSMKGIK
jgi:hypothetical protein